MDQTPSAPCIHVHVHVHASGAGGIFANAYLVETTHGVVAVDGTLTVSESRALRARLDAIGKPLLAVLVTHAHPDHVAGIGNLIGSTDVPILATQSVAELARAFEGPKRAQWKPVFGEEWIDDWTFPNRIVSDREAVQFDGVAFRVFDIGAGGDCDANAIWVMETDPSAAFVGDLLFNGTHVYLADGKILSWLANVERFRPLLSGMATLYAGHGTPDGPELLSAHRDYVLAYCAAVRDLLDGGTALSDAAKEELERRMEMVRPNAPLGFMVGLSADAVARELVQAE
ncbi:MAG: MBL fold metallo-hydrolase [Thermomicrobiales bacterium]